jgi:5'-nucleotidase
MGRWLNEWEVKDDPRGSKGKWLFLTGEFVVDDTDPEADRVALDNNYVTITPISIDMTDYKLLEEMKQWNL